MKYPRIQIKNLKNVFSVNENSLKIVDELRAPVTCRATGELKGKAFYLDKYYDWIIVKDSKDILCLLPLKKEKKKENAIDNRPFIYCP